MKNITRAHLLRLLPKVSLLLLLTFLAQSCKKELFEFSQTRAQPVSKIQDIKYAEFMGVVNASGMGNLKELLAPANQGGNGQKLMATNVSERQFRIDMNAVKKLVLGDTVSYVVSLMPSSEHAVHFQNLTVQRIKDNTTAFLATYIPSKEWIADWKNGRHLAFSGTVSFSRIDPKLIDENAGTTANIEPASNQNLIGAGNGKVSSVATNNKISLAKGECEIFDIYSLVPHPCSTGDWPGFCEWEIGGLTPEDVQKINGGGAHKPYYTLDMSTVVNCAAPDILPSGGGGGGGATTPTPPSDYDPCPGGAGPIAYTNVYGGLKLAVAAGNPCDGGETGLTPIPANPAAAAIQSLIANLPITDYAQQQYLYNNTNVVVAIYNYLTTNGWTTENKEFASWAVGYLTENPATFPSFKTVFLDGPIELPNSEVKVINNVSINLSGSDYAFGGLSNSFTESEFDNVIENLGNDFNDDPIQFYLIACYKNSKTLGSSIYSVAANSIKIGDYSLTPHYNSKNILMFYTAWRSSSLGVEFIVKANALNSFKSNHDFYRASANLFYVNGKPKLSDIMIGGGDYWEGILQAYKEAFSDPMYYVYLGHAFIGAATNLKTVPNTNEPIKFTSITRKGSEYPSIKIENMTIQQYKNAISAKYNKPWILEPNNPLKSRLQVDNKMYFEHPSTSSPYPSIDVSRNGKMIGKFRFKN